MGIGFHRNLAIVLSNANLNLALKKIYVYIHSFYSFLHSFNAGDLKLLRKNNSNVVIRKGEEV